MRVEVLERKEHLSRVVRHVLLHCSVVLPDLAQQGAPLDVLQLKVKVLLVLETAVDIHKEWAFRGHVEVGVISALVLDLVQELLVPVAQVLKHLPLIDNMVYMLHACHTLLF